MSITNGPILWRQGDQRWNIEFSGSIWNPRNDPNIFDLFVNMCPSLWLSVYVHGAQIQGPPRSAPGDGGEAGRCDPGLPAGHPRLQAVPLPVPAPWHAAAALPPLLARPQGEDPGLSGEAAHRTGDDQQAETMSALQLSLSRVEDEGTNEGRSPVKMVPRENGSGLKCFLCNIYYAMLCAPIIQHLQLSCTEPPPGASLYCFTPPTLILLLLLLLPGGRLCSEAMQRVLI